MKITKKFLKSLDPCKCGFEYWVQCKTPDLATFMIKAWEDDHADIAHWLFIRSVPRVDYLRYVMFSAELVLSIYEKNSPGDTRPRYTINATKRVIEDDFIENRELAANAAKDDYAANATAARTAAAYAAKAAYAAYADCSAYFAYPTYAAAYAAKAAYAAYAAVSEKRKAHRQIIDYGISLLSKNKMIEVKK